MFVPGAARITLHHAASLSGHDVFEPLYDVSHVASALALQDNTHKAVQLPE